MCPSSTFGLPRCVWTLQAAYSCAQVAASRSCCAATATVAAATAAGLPMPSGRGAGAGIAVLAVMAVAAAQVVGRDSL